MIITFWILMLLLLIWLWVWLYGLSLMLSAVKTLRTGLQSKSWLATQALVSNRVIKTSSPSRTEGTYYSYVVFYTYAVNGIEHTSEGFRKRGFAHQVEAEIEVGRLYPMGSTVSVFYNPKKHDELVLSKGFNEKRQVSFLFSFLGGSLIFSVMTALLGSLILQRIFNVSGTDAGKLTQALGMTVFLLSFCCNSDHLEETDC
jgi:hypothetical protein